MTATVYHGTHFLVLMQMLQPGANSSVVPLRVRDQSDPSGPGSPALYPRFWRVAGEQCTIKPGDLSGALALESMACTMALRQDLTPEDGGSSWDDWWEVQCLPDSSRANATLRRSLLRGKLQAGSSLSRSPAASKSSGSDGGDDGGYGKNGELVNGVSSPSMPPSPQPAPHPDPWASCSQDLSGPGAVLVLERVQSGFLGATLSRFGITGEILLYCWGGLFTNPRPTSMMMHATFFSLNNFIMMQVKQRWGL